MTAEDQALIEQVTADQLREQATQARQRAEHAHGEAEQLLSAAREQARRIVADAEATARTLTAAAKVAGQEADAAEQRAQTIDHARRVAEQVDAAERHVADLAGKHAAITERIATLAAKLADLGRQREDATTALASARDAGDVDTVTTLWTRMSAIDEITATLTGQLDVARARATAIGETGWGGEYDQATIAAAKLRQELSGVLDVLDADRPGRRMAQTTREYAQTLMASGVPEDKALAAAALLVAIGQYPEAALAAFDTTSGEANGSHHRQELRALDGSLVAELTRRT